MASNIKKKIKRCKRIDNSFIYADMSRSLFRFINSVEDTEFEIYPDINKDEVRGLYNALVKAYGHVEKLRVKIDEWKEYKKS